MIPQSKLTKKEEFKNEKHKKKRKKQYRHFTIANFLLLVLTLISVEGSEGELALCAGDYLLVWGNGEPQGGYLDAELLDGRRGLVPASFVQRLVGKKCPHFIMAT
jgi:hypothetical protein